MATTPEQFRQFRIRHRERLRLEARQYRKDKRVEIAARRKLARAKNWEHIRVLEKAQRARNINRVKASDKRYRLRLASDPERKLRANKVKADYMRNRRHSDLLYRITNNLRSRVNGAIRYQNGKRAHKTVALIGTSVALLRTWIASQFKPGMSWDNYGEWSIDHIIPCIEFDLTKEAQQRQCFHYSNLQPLWKPQNISKGRTLPAAHQFNLPLSTI